MWFFLHLYVPVARFVNVHIRKQELTDLGEEFMDYCADVVENNKKPQTLRDQKWEDYLREAAEVIDEDIKLDDNARKIVAWKLLTVMVRYY